MSPMYNRNEPHSPKTHIQLPSAGVARAVGQCPHCLGPAIHLPDGKTCREVKLKGHDSSGNPKK